MKYLTNRWYYSRSLTLVEFLKPIEIGCYTQFIFPFLLYELGSATNESYHMASVNMVTESTCMWKPSSVNETQISCLSELSYYEC